MGTGRADARPWDARADGGSRMGADPRAAASPSLRTLSTRETSPFFRLSTRPRPARHHPVLTLAPWLPNCDYCSAQRATRLLPRAPFCQMGPRIDDGPGGPHAGGPGGPPGALPGGPGGPQPMGPGGPVAGPGAGPGLPLPMRPGFLPPLPPGPPPESQPKVPGGARDAGGENGGADGADLEGATAAGPAAAGERGPRVAATLSGVFVARPRGEREAAAVIQQLTVRRRAILLLPRFANCSLAEGTKEPTPPPTSPAELPPHPCAGAGRGGAGGRPRPPGR